MRSGAVANPPDRTARLVLLAAGGVGAAAVMTQLVSMRELVGAFSGNELVFGLSLGSWLLLTGIGAWLGGAVKRTGDNLKSNGAESSSEGGALSPPGDPDGADGAAPSNSVSQSGAGTTLRLIAGGLMAVALLPLLQVLAARGLRDVVFPRGAAVGVTGTVLGTITLLAPFCLVSGALLTIASRVAANTGRVYLADTLGSIAGGAIFSFALVPWFDHFAMLCVPAVVNLALAAWLLQRAGARAMALGAGGCAASIAVVAVTLNVDGLSTRWQHRGTVVFRASSPYGRLVVTRDAGQLTFFENGVPLIFSDNAAQLEETVHYAMAQRPDARRVLLIGGGVAGAAREVLRYHVDAVTCVELDPRMIEAGQQLLRDNLASLQLKLVVADGRRFIQRTAEKFDVVIVDLPDPSTFQLNRFFTTEFFAAAKRVLTPGGVLSFGLGRYENFVSPELAQLLASAHRTLRTSFAEVRMVPGGRVFFLASDGPLTLDIAARLEQRSLATRLVNRHYLGAMLAPDRLADLERAFAQPAALNTDFNPVLYYYHLRHWLSQFAAPAWVLGAVLTLALAAYLVWLPAVPRVIFASGFAASSLEVVMLLAFQVGYGSLYQQVGLVVTVFMAGLALGAAWANRRPSSPDATLWLRWLAVAVAALALLLPWLLPRLSALDLALGTDLAGQAAILVLTFGLAAIVGAQFPLASVSAAAAPLFTADLIGAALGALLVSALLIPLAGVTAVCLATAGLNLAAAALTWRQPHAA